MSNSAPEFAASAVPSTLELLRKTAGRVDLASTALIELRGEDAKGWLHKQVTQDLREWREGAFTKFCLCKPTGQIESLCSAWHMGDHLLIATVNPEPLQERVDKFVIMEDVTASVREGHYQSIQGPAATEKLSQFTDLTNLDATYAEFEGEKVPLLRRDRTGMGGWDVMVTTGSAADKALSEAFPLVEEDAYMLATLEAGFPIVGVDVDSKTLPPELGEEFDRTHVSYDKGCYPGQEILARIKSRGHTNRTWCGILLEGQVAAGAQVSSRIRQDSGIVTRAGLSPVYGWIAAAMIRNEAAHDGFIVTVQGPHGPVEGEVVMMPILQLE